MCQTNDTSSEAVTVLAKKQDSVENGNSRHKGPAISGRQLGVWESSLEDQSNMFSGWVLHFLTPLLRLGATKVLDADDIGVPSKQDLARPNYELTVKAWEEEVAQTKAKNDKIEKDFQQKLDKCKTDEEKEKMLKSKPAPLEPKLTPVLFSSFGRWKLYFAMFMYFCSAVLQFVPIFLLEDLVKFFERGATTENYQGYAHPWVEVVALGTVPLFIAIFQTRYQVMMSHGATFVRTVVSIMLYHKSLRVSAAGRAKTSTGQIVNMMSNDTAQLQRVLLFAGMVFVAPLQIIAAIALIYIQVGNATWVGLAFMLALAPVNVWIFSICSKQRRKVLKYSDLRVKMMNEVLNGIRIIKFYAWEKPFRKEIHFLRKKEVDALTKLAYTSSVGVSLVLSSVPLIQPVLVFATYIFVSDQPLTASTAFTTIALFNMMRIPFAFLPLGLLQFLQGKIAIGRLERYLYLPELPDYVLSTPPPDATMGSDATEVASVTIRGDFSWVDPDADEIKPVQDESKKRKSKKGGDSSRSVNSAGPTNRRPSNASDMESSTRSIRTQNSNVSEEANLKPQITLRNMDHTIPAGNLVAVVGTVGSGKSSLLSAILGEMETINGGTVFLPRPKNEEKNSHFTSYCAQTPWVLNDTLRGNILFGRDYDEDRYNKVIEVCALLDDIAILPAGDMTEIGERGINLSGGQKARVCLARAFYSAETKLMLLDDPLSAVDAHVGEHLFAKAICGELAQGKTRILVTHHVHTLRRCDSVIVMDNGTIKHYGKYEDLIAQGVDFAGAVEVEKKDEIEEDKDGEGEDKKSDKQVEKKEEKVADGTEKREHTDDAKAKGKKLTSDEEIEEGSVEGSAYMHYARAGGICIAVIMLIVQGFSKGTDIMSNFWLAIWAEQSVKAEMNGFPLSNSETSFYLGIYGLFGFLAVVGIILQGVVFAFHRLRASNKLHDDLTKSILLAPVAFFDVTPTGRILNRFAADMDKVDLELTQTLQHGLSTVYSVIGAFGAILAATKGTFAIPLIPLGYLYYRIQEWFRKSATEIQRINNVANSPIFADFSQTLSGTPTIRAYGEETRFSNHCMSSFDNMNASYVLSQIVFYWLAVRLDVMGGLVGAFIAGIALVTSEFIPAGWVGLALSYSIEVTGVLKHGVRMIATLEAQMNSVERILYYTDKIDVEAPEEIPENDPKAGEWPSKGEVVFKNMSMRYRDGPLVLKNLSLKVQPGEKIGVCGRTGSGKSSMMISLFRISEIEDGGQILIDGVDTSKIGTTALRRNLSIIPQDPTLFSNTVRYNLDPFGEATEERLWEVLERVQMDNVIAALAMGLDEPVSEGGENFSQGQRQLICIARALLQNPKILVMDEATASIDNATDEAIQKMIRENFKSATVLTIAHRLGTIMDSDRVLVLDNGEIAEFDTPEKLLENPDGHFRSMVDKSRAVRNE